MKRGWFKSGRFFFGKRGQVTVFIIAAILIVGLAVMIYFLRPGITSTTEFEEKNPSGFIQTCMEDEINNAVNLVSLQGGSINPEGFILYQDNKIEYLCYTIEYYKKCVVQQPLLKSHIESEIKKKIESSVTSCFEKLVASYDSAGYKTTLEKSNSDPTRVELLPKRIVSTFNYTLTASKTDTKKYNSFSVVLNNNLYELASIANSIIDSESSFGDADPGFYMSIYPDLKVEKFNQDDGSTIYIVTDRNKGNSFQLASRSVVWPPGYGISGVSTN
jgi:hypothetical protein